MALSKRGKPPEVRLSKLMTVRLTERNHDLVYTSARREGIKISDFINRLIRENVKLRLTKK